MNMSKPIVYLVDDDPSIVKAVSRTLRLNGMEVQAYTSAKGFLDNYIDKPSCLVLDLSMPEMNGLELQNELEKQNNNIPIIFITGHGGVPESVQAVRAGAIDFLEKPFLPEVLLQRIDEALALDQTNRNRDKEIQEIRNRFKCLTDRERDVLQKLTRSTSVPSSKEIAKELEISYRTIEHHRSRILEKTKTATISELRALIKELNFDPLDI